MKEAKHTPGPWKAHIDMDGRHRHLAILTEAPEFLVEGWPYHPKIATALHGGKGDCPREIAEANARLIAAAPELLEALEQQNTFLEAWFAALGQIENVPNGILHNIQQRHKINGAILAKATGSTETV